MKNLLFLIQPEYVALGFVGLIVCIAIWVGGFID